MRPYQLASKVNQPTETDTTRGRWPTNLVLVHLPGCRREGVKKVKGGNDPRRRDGTRQVGIWHGGEDAYQVSGHTGFSDAEGRETVPAWSCTEGCPVFLLD